MKSFQLTRLNVSSYQDPNFLTREKDSLQSLGLRYRLNQQEIDDSPLILLTNTHSTLANHPTLLEKTKLIIHPNSGYDNLVNDYHLIKNIPTIIGHEIRAQAVAEWILSAFFEASIKRPVHHEWDTSRKWERTLLRNKEVVIFGGGHIGKIVEASLRALGIQTYMVDPYLDGIYKSYHDLPCKKYLALIACCGLNEKNKEMFNNDLFSHLSFDFFINGARGGLVNEEDLLDYLSKNHESYAYLDVFQTEPFIAGRWEKSHQVIRSSHIAGVYQELDSEIIRFEYQVLKDFLELSGINFNKKYHSQLLSSKFRDGVII